MAQRKIIKIGLSVFDSDFFGAQVAVDELASMEFFEEFDEAGEVGQGLLELKDMAGSTMCELKEIDIDKL